MKVAIVAICKMENLYLRDWVNHNKAIGIDDIYLIDNNDVEIPNVPEWVNIIDARGEVCREGCKNIQAYYYNKVFQDIRYNYDWIGFIDIDEYVVVDDIKKFLEPFVNFTGVCLNWINYTTYSTHYHKDNKYYPTAVNTTCKTFINTKNCVSTFKINSVHNPKDEHAVYANADGEIATINNTRLLNTSLTAYIKHFITRSLEEYISIKMRRGHPCRLPHLNANAINLSKFKLYNAHFSQLPVGLTFRTYEEILHDEQGIDATIIK